MFYIFNTIAFLFKKSWRKVQVLMTPQELVVCGESNEINGEKNLCSTAEK